MTYHTSSLRPHTDNRNHVTQFFFPYFFLLRYSDRAAATASINWVGGAARWRRTPSEDSVYRLFPQHRVCIHSWADLLSIQPPPHPPCPLKSHILPCLAKEHSVPVWLLSLSSYSLQWEGLSRHTGCVKTLGSLMGLRRRPPAHLAPSALRCTRNKSALNVSLIFFFFFGSPSPDPSPLNLQPSPIDLRGTDTHEAPNPLPAQALRCTFMTAFRQ